MRIVLDTNVFVSGIFFSGPPYRILKAWNAGTLDLVVSDEILSEYKRVAAVLALEHPPVNVRPFIEMVERRAILVDAVGWLQPVCEDPDNDKFLACALAGGVGTIVSGDRHLLKVSGYQGIAVMRPREFVDEYLR